MAGSARSAKSEKRGRLAAQAGLPPVPYDGAPQLVDLVADTSTQTFVKPGKNSAGKRTSANRSASGFNLRGVCEVLEEFGLDPVAEIARVLEERKPMIGKATGEPLVDEKGRTLTVSALPIDVRAKVLLELTNYVHAKKKSIEHTVKPPELTDTQLEARLAALLQRAAAKALD